MPFEAKIGSDQSAFYADYGRCKCIDQIVILLKTQL